MLDSVLEAKTITSSSSGSSSASNSYATITPRCGYNELHNSEKWNNGLFNASNTTTSKVPSYDTITSAASINSIISTTDYYPKEVVDIDISSSLMSLDDLALASIDSIMGIISST